MNKSQIKILENRLTLHINVLPFFSGNDWKATNSSSGLDLSGFILSVPKWQFKMWMEEDIFKIWNPYKALRQLIPLNSFLIKPCGSSIPQRKHNS